MIEQYIIDKKTFRIIGTSTVKAVSSNYIIIEASSMYEAQQIRDKMESQSFEFNTISIEKLLKIINTLDRTHGSYTIDPAHLKQTIKDSFYEIKPSIPHNIEALNHPLWIDHKIGDLYTMDNKPDEWRITYYPIVDDNKTKTPYEEPRALVEKPMNGGGIDFREVPLRYLTKKIDSIKSEQLKKYGIYVGAKVVHYKESGYIGIVKAIDEVDSDITTCSVCWIQQYEQKFDDTEDIDEWDVHYNNKLILYVESI